MVRLPVVTEEPIADCVATSGPPHHAERDATTMRVLAPAANCTALGVMQLRRPTPFPGACRASDGLTPATDRGRSSSGDLRMLGNLVSVNGTYGSLLLSGSA